MCYNKYNILKSLIQFFGKREYRSYLNIVKKGSIIYNLPLFLVIYTVFTS